MKDWLKRIGLAKGAKREPSHRDGTGHQRLSMTLIPERLYAIGDVHGCLDLYQALETHIVNQARRDGFSGRGLIVLLGDVIDRGPQTAQMIDHLLKPAPSAFSRLTLLGNHEQMMMQFLQDPETHRDWLKFGGRDTLLSYGLPLEATPMSTRGGKHFRNLLHSHIGDTHRHFLRTLPVCLTAGPYLFSHAGYAATKPLDAQSVDDFLWSNPAAQDRETGDWISVHGHTIVEHVLNTPKRIAIDTGAVETGRLTAVKLGTTGIIETLEAHRVGSEITVRVDVAEQL